MLDAVQMLTKQFGNDYAIFGNQHIKYVQLLRCLTLFCKLLRQVIILKRKPWIQNEYVYPIASSIHKLK